MVPKRRYGKNNKVGFWGVKLAFENCKNDAVLVNPPPIWAIRSLSLSKRHPQQNTTLQNWALCLSLQQFCCIYQVTHFAIFFNGFLSNFFWLSFLVLDWYFWPLGICCFLFIMEEKVFFFFGGGSVLWTQNCSFWTWFVWIVCDMNGARAKFSFWSPSTFLAIWGYFLFS